MGVGNEVRQHRRPLERHPPVLLAAARALTAGQPLQVVLRHGRPTRGRDGWGGNGVAGEPLAGQAGVEARLGHRECLDAYRQHGRGAAVVDHLHLNTAANEVERRPCLTPSKRSGASCD